jgi:hypothetical protein
MTARQIIAARLGRDLGPLATMPRDLRNALYRLALELAKSLPKNEPGFIARAALKGEKHE